MMNLYLRPTRRFILTCLGGVLMSVIAVTTCAYIYQNKLVFVPSGTPEMNPKMNRSPAEYKIPFEDLFIDSTDGAKLHLWFLKQNETKDCATVIFFHGNAGNVGYRLPNLAQMYHLAGVNIIAVSYRGYGLSTGEPSEQGLFDDGQTVLDYVKQRDDIIDPKKIFIFGRSLGGAVAIKTVEQNQGDIAGCIVENSFSSLTSLVKELLPLFAPFMDLLLKYRFNSLDSIRNIEVPTMLISGQQDKLIPADHMRKLLDGCASLCKWHILIHGGEHNDSHLINPVVYYDAMTKFIQDALEKKPVRHVIDIHQDNNNSDDPDDNGGPDYKEECVHITDHVTVGEEDALPTTTTSTTSSEECAADVIKSRPSRYFETVVRKKGVHSVAAS